MKTILYQPLFINPQAYFVFPQLYHIDGSLERVQSLGAWNTITINTDSVVSYLTKNKYNI